MSQALYRKWRPTRFDQVIGQEHITQTLKNSIIADRVGHAYLFCGPRGTGKTTSARLLAKAVNCLSEDPSMRPCDDCRICLAINEGRFMDLIEIDAASNTGVDDIRDLRDKINFAPNDGQYKVYIIDEVHMLSTAAFNALLKTLEEPPPHAKFVLATTEEHKVPQTIKSRCQQFNFRLLTNQEILNRLNWIIEQEGIPVEDGVLDLVAEHGAGSLRDSESLLDQLVGAPDEPITVARAQAVLGTAASESVATLTEAILDRDAAAGLDIIHTALNTGADARQFARQMVAFIRQILLIQASGAAIKLDMTSDQRASMDALAQRSNRRILIEAIKRFNEAAATASSGWQPQLPLELAFIESIPVSDGMPPPQPAVQVVQQAPVQPVTPKSEPVSKPMVADPTPSEQETAAPPQPTTAPAGSGFSIADIRGKTWREFVATAGRSNRNIKNWLQNSEPLAVQGDQLILGFDLEFLKKKLQDNLPEVNRALSQVLGQSAQVKLMMKADYLASGQAPQQSGRSLRDDVEDLANELGGVVRRSE